MVAAVTKAAEESDGRPRLLLAAANAILEMEANSLFEAGALGPRERRTLAQIGTRQRRLTLRKGSGRGA
ncbi:hypothetical protein AYO47_03550 [Planctomyces sp. SCGC AG-212-M04]|nr:hypothetical protein AYO47_03550 [Planctomyces sp. SCGC AG-212-M04]